MPVKDWLLLHVAPCDSYAILGPVKEKIGPHDERANTRTGGSGEGGLQLVGTALVVVSASNLVGAAVTFRRFPYSYFWQNLWAYIVEGWPVQRDVA